MDFNLQALSRRLFMLGSRLVVVRPWLAAAQARRATPIPIGLADFAARANEVQLARDVTAVVSNDLRSTDRFRLIESPPDFAPESDLDADPPFADWHPARRSSAREGPRCEGSGGKRHDQLAAMGR